MADGKRAQLIRASAWALLTLSYLVIYAPALGHGFVWDDLPAIVENPKFHGPLVQGLLSTQQDHLGTGPQDLSGVRVAHDSYRPFLFLSYRIDAALFGLSARAMHAHNLLLGFGTVVVVFVAARWWLASWWAGLAVAVLFALHPAQVEAVTYISGRGDLLAGFFVFLGTALASRAYDAVGRYRVLVGAGVCACFFFSLLCKEAYIGWPVALGAIFWSKSELRRQWTIVAWSALTALLYLALRIKMAGAGTGVSLVAGIVALPGTWLEVLRIGALPFDLSTERLRDPSLVPYGWALLFLMGLAMLVDWTLRPRRLPKWLRNTLSGFAWSLVLIGPSVLVVLSLGVLADRYLYAPLAGFFVVCVATGRAVLQARPRALAPLAVVSATVVAILAITSVMQVRVWRDNISLYTHATQFAPQSSMAWYRLGFAHASQHRWAAAIPLFERALQLDPNNHRARNNLSVCLMNTGAFDRARELLSATVRREPAHYRAWYNLGFVEIHSGRTEIGCRALDRAIAIKPRYPEARQLRADACAPESREQGDD